MQKPNFNLHANGVPPGECPAFEAVAKAAVKAGCSAMQASIVAKLAYLASHNYYWDIQSSASGLLIHSTPAKFTAGVARVSATELQSVRTALSVSGMFLSGGTPMGDPAYDVEQLRKKYGQPEGIGLDMATGEFVKP